MCVGDFYMCLKVVIRTWGMALMLDRHRVGGEITLVTVQLVPQVTLVTEEL